METLLIDEQFVSQFKYWREGQVRSGMRFRNDLFEYISQFDYFQRNRAFDLAWHIAQTGRETIVTASQNQYRVWINLRVVDRAGVLNQSDAAVANDSFTEWSTNLWVHDQFHLLN